MDPSLFMQQLRRLAFPNAFNPYTDTCPEHDTPGAPQRRAKALRAALDAAAECQGGVESIWLGRDLGHLGGRRTGIALTDEAHFAEHAARWGLQLGFNRPVEAAPPSSENTAGTVWRALQRIGPAVPIFLWNAFPLHPHQEGNINSNRRHNRQERAAGEALLQSLISLLRPRRIIAVGEDADKSAKRAGAHCVSRVRHPSHGGTNIFTAQISALYNLA